MPDATHRLLLIGWDGADWRLITPLLERGELPHLETLINEGVMGNLSSLQPMQAPLVWTSVATGKYADKHGVLGFAEVEEGTGEVRASTSLSRKTKAVWNILSQEGLRTHVVNWPCSHPAEPINGVCVSELFAPRAIRQADDDVSLPQGAVHPQTLRGALSELLVAPQEIDSQTIGLFVPRLDEVDQHNDHRLEAIAVQLAECSSVHAAATWLMENEPWDFMAVQYEGIDRLCHSFMPYHPPRLPWVNEKEYELYNDVISSIYRLHDLLLGRLMNLAGPETTILLCSGHGWQCGHLRGQKLHPLSAAPAEEHRPVGILVMKGHGIQQDELVHGAGLLDITPTILTLLDLPVGRGMDGRPLAEAFAEGAPGVRLIASWEDVPGPAGMHSPGTEVDTGDLGVLMRRLVDLHYVEPTPGEADEMAKLTRRDRRWNLARVYRSSGRHAEALPLLEQLYDESPLRLGFGLAKAESLFLLGLTDEACEIMRSIAQAFPEEARARMAGGVAEYYAGRPEAALADLSAVEEQSPPWPQLFVYLGMVYSHLQRYSEAMRAYDRALELDADAPDAHLGVALCLLHRGSYEEAVEWALQALGREFSRAEAHFCLGSALAKLGRVPEAIRAYEAGLHFGPGRAEAHRALSFLYARLPDGSERASAHLRMAAECTVSQSEAQERLSRLRAEVTARAGVRERVHEEESRRLMAAVAAGETAAQDSRQPLGVPKRGAPGSSGKEFLIVSGIPGAGTSLMMRMLAAGGVPLLIDDERPADVDHPDGYFEWEPVARLRRNPDIIEEADGKAVKVVSPLLPYLPRVHKYSIIFMRRPGGGLVAAQSRMLQRGGQAAPLSDRPGMPRLLDRLQDIVTAHLQEAPIAKSLVVDYPDLMTNTAAVVDSVREFVGPLFATDRDAMVSLLASRATGPLGDL